MSREDALVDQLSRLFATTSADVAVGIGDDAAILRARGLEEAWSVDAAVEGVHFDLALLSVEEAGGRAFRAALSDLAAMGAQPKGALVAIAAPPDAIEPTVLGVARGIAAAAGRLGCPVVGGNLARARELSITTTVVGVAPPRALLRSGAKPGDAICVSGPLGAAALGLAALRAGLRHDLAATPFVRAFLEPEPRLALGSEVAARATSGMDLSDGVAIDLRRLCRASGVGAHVDLGAVPVLEHHGAFAVRLGVDALAAVAFGGEDFELLYTVPRSALRAADHVIGEVRAVVDGVSIVGAPRSGEGFSHFPR